MGHKEESSSDETKRVNTVRQVAELFGTEPIIVLAEESILAIPEKVADRPACRTLAVVDQAGTLVGVLPVTMLMDDIFLQVMPEEFLRDDLDPEEMVNLARGSEANTARDLMQPPTYVRMDQSFRSAFVTMHRHRLTGLPIVDDSLKVVGYLDMFQLLLVWLRTRAG